jgi:hypothetical protein
MADVGGQCPPKFFGHENLVDVPTVYSREENFGGTGFQPVPAQAKLSWPYLTTPADEKCGTAAPGCSFPEQARAPAPPSVGNFSRQKTIELDAF